MTIVEWLRHVAERRRAAFGPEGMIGCRFEEAAETIERQEAYIEILEIELGYGPKDKS